VSRNPLGVVSYLAILAANVEHEVALDVRDDGRGL
jgi:hypothetical protein